MSNFMKCFYLICAMIIVCTGAILAVVAGFQMNIQLATCSIVLMVWGDSFAHAVLLHTILEQVKDK